MDWLIGLAGSLVIAGAAYAKKSLSRSGLAAAVAMGTLLYALGSAAWFGTLLAFFVSSSALSRLKPQRKADAESGYAKSGRRDAGQVAANGGLGLLLCAGHALWPHPIWWALYVGALAAVNADTWATELGGLSRRAPRSIVSGRRVAPGVSGGVTPLGLAASALGGAFIGAAGWLLLRWGSPPFEGGAAAGWPAASLELLPLVAAAGLAGLGGSLADSWLGAVAQAMYRCRACGREVERRSHCGEPTAFVRGWPWMTNDAVNALCSCAGAGLALLALVVLARISFI